MSERFGETALIKYCPIHLSTFISNDSDRCAWDERMGPRPGRGACEKHDATVIIGFGVRVWPLEVSDE